MNRSFALTRTVKNMLVAFVAALFSLGAVAHVAPAGLRAAEKRPMFAGFKNAVDTGAVHFRVSRLSTAAANRDTLYLTASPGEIVITVLPDSLDGSQIVEYTNIRTPTLSWRTGRAFFWQTGEGDIGVHHVDFGAATEAGADTLTVSVTVQP